MSRRFWEPEPVDLPRPGTFVGASPESDGQIGHWGSPDTIAAERREELGLVDALEPDEPDEPDELDPRDEVEAAAARARARSHHCSAWREGIDDDGTVDPDGATERAPAPVPQSLIGGCPGERVCFTRSGPRPCRAHGCRVCGAPVLADTEDWPAPLCIAHAPEGLFVQLEALRAVLRRHVDGFDGVHKPDCAVWLIFGQAVSDANIASEHERIKVELKGTPRSPCTCGATALRNEARTMLDSPESPS